MLSPFPVTDVDATLLIPLVVLATLALAPMLSLGQRISRREGWVLLAMFGGYSAMLIARQVT